MSERTTIGGVVYESVGSNTSNLLLKCNGTARIQWGNKLIDLIKNGKLASPANSEFIFLVSEESEMKSDGIYILENNESEQLWIRKNGTRYNLTGTDLYISANSNQALTADQKQQSLLNLGIYYNTVADLKNASITNGIAYVLEDNTLYGVIDGAISKLIAVESTNFNISEQAINSSTNMANNTTNNSSFTRGMIIMHSGITDIPEGWAICDGGTYSYNGVTSTTPNLSNRFIKGASTINDAEAYNGTIPINKDTNLTAESNDSFALLFIMKL
jgi:hypothetical protein